MKSIRLIPTLCSISLLAILSVWVSGCRSTEAIQPGSPSPTPLLAGETPGPIFLPTEPENGVYSLPHDPEEILELTFPTPGPEPVSLWRPPLYPAPWALGPYDHFYFTRPIAADVVNWPLKDYRYGGIFFSSDIVHTGIDIPNRKGTPVISAGPGRVVWAGYGLFTGANSPNDPYGLAVTVKHDFGYNGNQLYTIYAHMDRIDVINGQWVDTGTQLGVVGDTGLVTGPHLHFEVRIQNNSFYSTRNPELWLAPPQGWGVLVGRLLNTSNSMLNQVDVLVTSLETGRKWTVTTYGKDTVVSDDYYRENMVLSDLPAGEYEVSLEYQEDPMAAQITIRSGAVTYFTFHGKYGFGFDLPAGPGQGEILKPFEIDP